jgi:hypothetical protein
MIMSKLASLCARLMQDTCGSMAVETALVAPVLAVMAIGGFEASTIVARQAELQSAAAEAAVLAMAATPDTDAKLTTVKEVLAASTDIPEDDINVFRIYRCGTEEDYVLLQTSCGTDDEISTYMFIYMEDEYTPSWSDYGVGETVTFRVRHTVQLS